MTSVLIRADASHKEGSGHVVRCMRVAEQLEAQGVLVYWAVTQETVDVMPILSGKNLFTVTSEFTEKDGVRIETNAPQQVDQITRQAKERQISHFSVSITDGYHLSAPIQTELRKISSHIVAIDEKQNRWHDADLLFDFLAGHNRKSYGQSLPTHAKVFDGPDYMIVSNQVLDLKPSGRRDFNRAGKCRLLVMSGGFDGVNLINRILPAVSCLDPDKYAVDTGILSRAPHVQEIKTNIEKLQTAGFDATLHLDRSDVPALLTQSDIYVGAAGTTPYEACVLGVPQILFDAGHNQAAIGRVMQDGGAAIYLGKHDEPSQRDIIKAIRSVGEDMTRLRTMSAAAQKVCDGQGPKRIATEIMKLAA